MSEMAPLASQNVPSVTPEEIANKILRRSRVSKLTRELQKRLALANVKIQHGWENLSLSAIEPQLEKELKRKRSSSPSRMALDSSSHATFPRLNSSLRSQTLCPQDSLLHSDAPASTSGRSSISSGSSSKRARLNSRKPVRSVSSNHALRKASDSRWKVSAPPLPLSSPSRLRSHISPNCTFIRQPGPPINLPYGSSTSPLPMDSDDASSYSSETDDEDIPLPPPRHIAIPRSQPQPMILSHSSSANIRSSPPPVSTSTEFKFDGVSALGPGAQQTLGSGETGIDLLMFMPNPPSPTTSRFLNGTLTNQDPVLPATPPSKFATLPSTFMTGITYPDFTSFTPGNHFNFDDFLNGSPGPANVWRTTAATPARRRPLVDSNLPSVSVFADPAMTSTAMSLFGGTLDFGGDLFHQ